MKSFTAVLILFTGIIPLVLQANTIYVTDSLQLKLRASASTEGDIVTTLHSGQKLTIVAKEKNFTKVKTEEGEAGWVQSWFLTDKPPATFVVNEVTRQKEELEEKLNRAVEKLKNFDSATARENQSLKNSKKILADKITQLTSQNNLLNNKLEGQDKELAKYRFAEQYDLRLIVAVFFLISFILGFLFALIWSRSREKKRLSGYRLAQ